MHIEHMMLVEMFGDISLNEGCEISGMVIRYMYGLFRTLQDEGKSYLWKSIDEMVQNTGDLCNVVDVMASAKTAELRQDEIFYRGITSQQLASNMVVWSNGIYNFFSCERVLVPKGFVNVTADQCTKKDYYNFLYNAPTENDDDDNFYATYTPLERQRFLDVLDMGYVPVADIEAHIPCQTWISATTTLTATAENGVPIELVDAVENVNAHLSRTISPKEIYSNEMLHALAEDVAHMLTALLAEEYILEQGDTYSVIECETPDASYPDVVNVLLHDNHAVDVKYKAILIRCSDTQYSLPDCVLISHILPSPLNYSNYSSHGPTASPFLFICKKNKYTGAITIPAPVVCDISDGNVLHFDQEGKGSMYIGEECGFSNLGTLYNHGTVFDNLSPRQRQEVQYMFVHERSSFGDRAVCLQTWVKHEEDTKVNGDAKIQNVEEEQNIAQKKHLRNIEDGRTHIDLESFVSMSAPMSLAAFEIEFEPVVVDEDDLTPSSWYNDEVPKQWSNTLWHVVEEESEDAAQPSLLRIVPSQSAVDGDVIATVTTKNAYTNMFVYVDIYE